MVREKKKWMRGWKRKKSELKRGNPFLGIFTTKRVLTRYTLGILYHNHSSPFINNVGYTQSESHSNGNGAVFTFITKYSAVNYMGSRVLQMSY